MACAAPLSLPSLVEGEGIGRERLEKNWMVCFGWDLFVALIFLCSEFSSAQQLETLNVSYASVTGSRIPLWIAKDAGLFEKNGLYVNLVVIAAGNAAIGALASGDVEILGAPG